MGGSYFTAAHKPVQPRNSHRMPDRWMCLIIVLPRGTMMPSNTDSGTRPVFSECGQSQVRLLPARLLIGHSKFDRLCTFLNTLLQYHCVTESKLLQQPFCFWLSLLFLALSPLSPVVAVGSSHLGAWAHTRPYQNSKGALDLKKVEDTRHTERQVLCSCTKCSQCQHSRNGFFLAQIYFDLPKDLLCCNERGLYDLSAL